MKEIIAIICIFIQLVESTTQKGHIMTAKNAQHYEEFYPIALFSDAIDKKYVNWDGFEVMSFINSFSVEELGDINHYTSLYSIYYGDADDAFSDIDIDWLDKDSFPMEIRQYIVEGGLYSILIELLRHCENIKTSDYRNLVSHFFNLWLAMNGGC